ncbi:hypothetical protein [Burkholderia metallica]|uniref:hypothetical protein n=1 Tax=Burkholderia metallica TaxID=488729 RepID=UPI001CF4B49A|nr:hypothetical protein [Burkholderia metallica]MCA8018983.1 hypothetical protein [Burkholderia metallica]
MCSLSLRHSTSCRPDTKGEGELFEPGCPAGFFVRCWICSVNRVNDAQSSTVFSRMTAPELRATTSLAAIFALRMPGLFMIMPALRGCSMARDRIRHEAAGAANLNDPDIV